MVDGGGNWPWNWRKIWWGFTWMGNIQIPPNPMYIILTDRTTGTQYWLTYTKSVTSPDGFGYVAINSVLPQLRTINNSLTYDAYDEPIIGFLDDTNYARIMVDNGQLGVSLEKYNPQLGKNQAPWLLLVQDTALVGFNGEFAQLILSQTSPGWYAWLPIIVTQTPNPAPYNPLTDPND